MMFCVLSWQECTGRTSDDNSSNSHAVSLVSMSLNLLSKYVYVPKSGNIWAQLFKINDIVDVS